MAALRRINQDDLRNHNLSVVLDTMLRSTRPLSRAELAKATGLTKATMSLLVPMLADSGVIVERAPEAMSTYGRPSTPLAIAGGRFCGIGLQVNTDGYGYTMTDLAGDTLAGAWVSQPMDGTDPADVFARLDDLVSSGLTTAREKGYRIVGTGLALPGLIADDTRLLVARNLGWENLNLADFDVVRRLDAEAGNEANMAAIAQIPGYATQRMPGGIVEPSDSFIYVSTDIGIGGAIVREGQVEAGERGFAGEIGHVSVDSHGAACVCGRRGCLEAYAGRRALVENAGIATGADAVQIAAVDELLERWKAGEEGAVAAVDRAVEAIALVLTDVVNILDIRTVILGGLWQRFGNEVAARVERAVRPMVLSHPATVVRVVIPDVTVRPALAGAARVGLRRFVDNPLQAITE